MPERIQRLRTKGAKLPPNTVCVCRPGPYGNPFRVGIDGDAAECVARYKSAWDSAVRLSKMHPRSPPMPFGSPVYLGPLVGKNLACWCKVGDPCHADVLLEIASSLTSTESK